jgi:hypothetical protein
MAGDSEADMSPVGMARLTLEASIAVRSDELIEVRQSGS